MNKNIIIGIIVVVIIAVGAWWYWNQSSAPRVETPTTETHVIELTARNFSFAPAEIRVKKGDTVRIVLKNEEGNHNWKIDEFGVETKVITAGETNTVEFVADTVGSFEYYCSVMQHRQMGMRGMLIVEE